MKQILLLLLLPCFAMAQYPGNANQKITLGEQTTADGLVYRGVENDTALITPRSDTSAYIILDTVNNKFYNYNRTTNVWSLAGGGVSVTSFSAGTTGLTPNTATTGAVTLGGTLAVANGGTGSGTKNFVDLTTAQSVAGEKTFSNPTVFNSTLAATASSGSADVFKFKIIGSTSNGVLFSFSDNDGVSNGIGSNLSLNAAGSASRPNSNLSAWLVSMDTRINPKMFFIHINKNGDFSFPLTIDSSGNVGIGETVPTEKLHVVGNARITAVGAGAFGDDLNITSDGTLTTETSDEKYKYNILPINYGLNTILQLKPVNFQWIKGEENDLGFIAQDVAEIIPEAVNTNWNSDLLMRYNSIIPILTKAIQEQQALIKALEQRLLILENK